MTMELELDFGQEQVAHQSMKVSPRLVAANYILELSSQELQQQISKELSDNPALEQVDVANLPRVRHRAAWLDLPALHSASEGRAARPDIRKRGHLRRAAGQRPRTLRRRRGVRSADPCRLRADARREAAVGHGAVLPDDDLPIAEYLVGSLDEKGYLSRQARGRRLRAERPDEERVRAVLRVLQAQEPIGIGARNLRECLLIQIAHLEERGLSAAVRARDRRPSS